VLLRTHFAVAIHRAEADPTMIIEIAEKIKKREDWIEERLPKDCNREKLHEEMLLDPERTYMSYYGEAVFLYLKPSGERDGFVRYLLRQI
jgi:hypothetical protein